ncbi:hypothetical protein CKK33_05685 [Mucilaginibacter sp. MD40]|nr:hypothetical protein CKK33_05685 [Mucilaginibacter sp. MD40]
MIFFLNKSSGAVNTLMVFFMDCVVVYRWREDVLMEKSHNIAGWIEGSIFYSRYAGVPMLHLSVILSDSEVSNRQLS